MTTIIEGTRNGYSIPAKNEQHDDEFHVSVRLSNYRTKCYTTKNSRGWQDRIRSFVQRVSDEADCRIDKVTVNHVDEGERLSRRVWTANELSTIS